LMSDGTLRSFGLNGNGQLGIGNNLPSNAPQVIERLVGRSIIGISTGGYHTFVITSYTQVMSFGRNSEGQLGVGDVVDRNIPTFVTALGQTGGISCGGFHTIIEMKNVLFPFGSNTFGQLGLPQYISMVTFPSFEMKFENTFPTGVICGLYHSIATFSNGEVKSFGQNNCGQLGLSSQTIIDESSLFSNNSAVFSPTIIETLNGMNISSWTTTNGTIYTEGLCESKVECLCSCSKSNEGENFRRICEGGKVN